MILLGRTRFPSRRLLPCAPPAMYECAASLAAFPTVSPHYFIFCQPDRISVTVHLGTFHMSEGHVYVFHLSIRVFSTLFY